MIWLQFFIYFFIWEKDPYLGLKISDSRPSSRTLRRSSSLKLFSISRSPNKENVSPFASDTGWNLITRFYKTRETLNYLEDRERRKGLLPSYIPLFIIKYIPPYPLQISSLCNSSNDSVLGVLRSLIKYVDSLEFDEQPDYQYCISQLINELKVSGERIDWVMDWSKSENPKWIISFKQNKERFDQFLRA